jgi:hypothetical protein
MVGRSRKTCSGPLGGSLQAILMGNQWWWLGFWAGKQEKGREKEEGSGWLLGRPCPLSIAQGGSAMTGLPRTRRRREGRHGRPLHSRRSEMRHGKTILPLDTQRKYWDNHRVSLLSFPPTQEATRRPSPTSGSRTMQAPVVRDRGWMSSQGGYNICAKQYL